MPVAVEVSKAVGCRVLLIRVDVLDTEKCKGGRLVGNKCVPSYGPVGPTLGGTPIEIGGSQLGPTAAAGWAAAPGSPHVRWWHFIQNGQLNSIAVPVEPDDDQCPEEPDDD